MSGGQSENPRNQRPRVTLMIPEQSAYQYDSGIHQQHSPYIMTAATSGVPSQGQPNWPNPFLQQLYAQKAGDFVCKQFEGLQSFTKGGLSVGEKSAVWLYAKFRKWSRNWFTHCFLFIVVLLYSIAGALVFMTLEGNFVEFLRGRIYEQNSLPRTSCMVPNDDALIKDFFALHHAHEVFKFEPQSHVNRTAISCSNAREITTRHFVSRSIDLGSLAHVEEAEVEDRERKCLI